MGSILSSVLGSGGVAEAAEDDSSPSPSPSRVVKFHSSNQWQIHFNSSKKLNKLMVVDFAAAWCGPCKFIEPAIKTMSAKYTDVDFAKIDVDEVPDVAKEYKVEAMPTFILLKQGKVVDRVVGANKDELERKIVSHREAPKFAA